MPKEVSKLIEVQDNFFIKKKVHQEQEASDEVQPLESLDEGYTNLLTLDLAKTCHRVNSLCTEIRKKYSFNDEESIVGEESYEVQCVENSNETSTSSFPFDERSGCPTSLWSRT